MWVSEKRLVLEGRIWIWILDLDSAAETARLFGVEIATRGY